MKKVISCLVAGLVLTGTPCVLKAGDNSCNRKQGPDRLTCEIGQTIHRTEDYVRENAPRWRENVENAWQNTVESARRFGRGVREGYQNYEK